jgi:hypothetical protein
VNHLRRKRVVPRRAEFMDDAVPLNTEGLSISDDRDFSDYRVNARGLNTAILFCFALSVAFLSSSITSSDIFR